MARIEDYQHKTAEGLVPFKDVPTALQHHIRSQLSYIVVKGAFFAALLYGELELVLTESIPIAATDGKKVYLNPHNFETRSLKQGAFIICHEILHFVRGDCLMLHKFHEDKYVLYNGKKLPYSSEVMNWAEDFVINAMLKAANLGEMPDDALYDESLAKTGMESSLDVYAQLLQRGGKGQASMLKGGQYQRPGQGKPFDILIDPGKAAAAADNPQKRTQAVAAAAEVARQQGQLPACIARLLGDMLEPKVSWQDQIRSAINRRAGEPGYDWKLPDKRLIIRTPDPIYFARASHYGCGTIAIGVDVSGSIYQDPTIIRRFFAEMAGIIADLNPARLVVLWCDAAVQRVDDIEDPDDLNQLRCEINQAGGVNGGGGTDFRPVFDDITKIDETPDLLVFFTDGYGTFPERAPEYPVVWGMITDHKCPWGDIVRVEL